MVTGSGRFQPAVLIDLNEKPPEDLKEKIEMVETLLPTIEEANQHAPAHGQLDQDHTLFATPDKPIKYLGQGKIQRPRTYAKYKDDIDEVYRAAEAGENNIANGNIPYLDVSNVDSVAKWLQLLIGDLSDHYKDLPFDQDMFEAGIDSLHVIKMTREIKFQAKEAGWCQNDAQFLPTTIYKHPTCKQLGSYLHSLSHGRRPSMTDDHKNGALNSSTASKTMQVMLDKYIVSLPPSSQLSPPASTENMTILLTGSTGSLGSYVLDVLYANPNVSQIICLN